ncbi:helix-turn-helix transcriptional regulator [uncultured Alsobacter sp.]|uniref:helix-turn-helix domain-containing protein n=1 Tax=uncultured Alsobacter sp. TaxID=1748258 RepID=UPI0025CE4DAF|nr:helix-turn-helix transcriptional regulator [uncultured Alsobacter sp.]
MTAMHKGRLFKAARVLAGLTLAELAAKSHLSASEIERLEGQDVWPVGSAMFESALARALQAEGVEVDNEAPGLHLVEIGDEGIPAEALTAENDM